MEIADHQQFETNQRLGTQESCPSFRMDDGTESSISEVLHFQSLGAHTSAVLPAPVQQRLMLPLESRMKIELFPKKQVTQMFVMYNCYSNRYVKYLILRISCQLVLIRHTQIVILILHHLYKNKLYRIFNLYVSSSMCSSYFLDARTLGGRRTN